MAECRDEGEAEGAEQDVGADPQAHQGEGHLAGSLAAPQELGELQPLAQQGERDGDVDRDEEDQGGPGGREGPQQVEGTGQAALEPEEPGGQPHLADRRQQLTGRADGIEAGGRFGCGRVGTGARHDVPRDVSSPAGACSPR